MGVSTDGQLCYGIPFPERFRFPWNDDNDEYSQDQDEWWRKINGYKPPFEIYNKDGEYLNGNKPPEDVIDKYYEHRREWEKANPFPVEIVNYCSGECPMYMVAVKESLKKNSRGYPEVIDTSKLEVTEDQHYILLDFIKKYLKDAIDENDEEIPLEPKWYLSSYWG
jgi:hypothetical protein